MAAAIVPFVPLILGLSHDLIDYITGLAHEHAKVAEAAHGPGTGPTKSVDVFVNTMQDLVDAKVKGAISALPDESAVKLIIQSVVASMKLDNTLVIPVQVTPSVVPALPAPASVVLTPGHTITITVSL